MCLVAVASWTRVQLIIELAPLLLLLAAAFGSGYGMRIHAAGGTLPHVKNSTTNTPTYVN